MLDTNLWSLLADDLSSREFYRMLADRGDIVAIPPSVLLELSRNPNAAVRSRHIEAIFQGRDRDQLRSEAQMEADELVSEIRRLHPEWLLTRSDTARIASLESFWTRRVWRQARENSGALHAVGQRPEHLSPAAEAFEAQREQRRNLIHTGDDWSNVNLALLTWGGAAGRARRR
jgi:hypothetical protein